MCTNFLIGISYFLVQKIGLKFKKYFKISRVFVTIYILIEKITVYIQKVQNCVIKLNFIALCICIFQLSSKKRKNIFTAYKLPITSCCHSRRR